jgi:membrane protease YdiL (CAAX protease family)
MPFQWVVLAVFLLAMVGDHLVIWRSFARRVEVDPAAARHTLWLRWGAMMWGCSALVLWLWIANGVALSAVGFAVPTGWRLWVPLALGGAFVLLQAGSALKLSRLSAPSDKLRAQLGDMGRIVPHVAGEMPAFVLMSITAGFCEELLFRGFLIWVLQPFVGLWIAAALALVLFALGHAYQGREGIVRTGLIGLVFTVIVIATQSLWPAIVLHAAVDAMGGLIGWLIVREPVGTVDSREAVAP